MRCESAKYSITASASVVVMIVMLPGLLTDKHKCDKVSSCPQNMKKSPG